MPRLRRDDRIGRRDKRTWRKSGIDKSTVKPDTQLPSNLKRAEGFCIVAGIGVCRAIACDAELVKQISNLLRQDTIELQAAQQVRLPLLCRGKSAGFGGSELSQNLTELT